MFLMFFCWQHLLTHLLKRMSSCLSTVFMDSEYMTGYLIMTSSMSKFAGSLERMSPASSRHESAGDLPPAALVCRGSVSRMLLNN